MPSDAERREEQRVRDLLPRLPSIEDDPTIPLSERIARPDVCARHEEVVSKLERTVTILEHVNEALHEVARDIKGQFARGGENIQRSRVDIAVIKKELATLAKARGAWSGALVAGIVSFVFVIASSIVQYIVISGFLKKLIE